MNVIAEPAASDVAVMPAAGYIDPSGNIFGMANGYLVEWSPVPEPAPAAVLVALAAGLVFPRRRGKSLAGTDSKGSRAPLG